MTADIAAQVLAALGTPVDGSDPLQNLCDAAAADVARLTMGYVIDQTSLTNWTKIITTYRAYGLIGPVQPDIEKNFDSTWKELTEISQGKRPNLPKIPVPAQALIGGSFGGSHRLHGRLRPGLGGRTPCAQPSSNNDMSRTPTLVNGLPNTVVGPPTSNAQGGPWNLNDTWIDSQRAVFTCVLAGVPGQWLQVEAAVTNNLPAGAPVNYLAVVPNQAWAQFYWTGAAWEPVVSASS